MTSLFYFCAVNNLGEGNGPNGKSQQQNQPGYTFESDYAF